MSVQITFEGQPPKYLTAPSYKLGRASDCDLLLPENDPMVSRYHALLERDVNGQWLISDSSTNGTFVNGEKLSGRRSLRSGDQIGIGRTQIGFLSSQTAASSAAPSSAATPRATETVFVSQQELQAKIAAASAPFVPVAPSVGELPPLESPELEPNIALSQSTPSMPETAESLESAIESEPSSPVVPVIDESPEPVVAPLLIAPDVLEAAPVLAEIDSLPESEIVFQLPVSEPTAEFSSMPSEAPKQNDIAGANSKLSDEPVIAAVSEHQPIVPKLIVSEPEKLALPPITLAPAPSADEEQKKQCTRCRNLYSFNQQDCPACGHTGFKMKNTAPTVAVASNPVLPVSAPPEQKTFESQIPNPVTPSAPPPPVMPPAAPLQPQQPAVSHVIHHVSAPMKSSGLALVLSLFFTGAGQIYNGQAFKGIFMFFTALVLFSCGLIPIIGFLFWLPAIAFHIWNIVDAHATAERINARAAIQANSNLPR